MTLRHINIRWRQIWCFRKGNRKEKVVTLCITPFNVEQTTCIVCYAFSAFSLIATHLNDPVSVCYPDWMDEGKLGKREQKKKKKKRLPNTWMHQPEGQKDKCKSSCTAVIKKKCPAYAWRDHSLPTLTAASVGGNIGALPVVAHLTAWGLQSDLFITDLTGVKTRL